MASYRIGEAAELLSCAWPMAAPVWATVKATEVAVYPA
jgi:hypothetical protein